MLPVLVSSWLPKAQKTATHHCDRLTPKILLVFRHSLDRQCSNQMSQQKRGVSMLDLASLTFNCDACDLSTLRAGGASSSGASSHLS